MRGVTLVDYIDENKNVISTHTPHARRDVTRFYMFINLIKFQLTRLMRGVTYSKLIEYYLACISTHTPHARRDSKTRISL